MTRCKCHYHISIIKPHLEINSSYYQKPKTRNFSLLCFKKNKNAVRNTCTFAVFLTAEWRQEDFRQQHRDDPNFTFRIVTGDEGWVYRYDSGTNNFIVGKDMKVKLFRIIYPFSVKFTPYVCSPTYICDFLGTLELFVAEIHKHTCDSLSILFVFEMC